MKQVLENEPVKVFQIPEGVVFAKIDAESGKLAIPESKKTVFACFKEGTAPEEYADKPGALKDEDQFMKFDM